MKIFILFCFLCYRRFINVWFIFILSMFGLLSAYYDVILFVILLQRFICVRTIQIDKIDMINQIYQIMIVSILKN